MSIDFSITYALFSIQPNIREEKKKSNCKIDPLLHESHPLQASSMPINAGRNHEKDMTHVIIAIIKNINGEEKYGQPR
jgi:hypothetical protein